MRADAILQAMNSRLWLKDEGHWAEFQDFMGLKRLHRDAAIWSIYTPIDCGACTPAQAYQSTVWMDSCIPHIPVAYTVPDKYADKIPAIDFPLSTISTSDWML